MKILKSLLAVCISLLICDTHASKHHKKSHKTEKVEHKKDRSGHHKSHKSRVHDENSQETEDVYQKEYRSRHHKSHEEGVNDENFKSDASGLFGAYNKQLEEKAVEQAESTDGDYTE